jgi:hypothetical protein
MKQAQIFIIGLAVTAVKPVAGFALPIPGDDGDDGDLGDSCDPLLVYRYRV